MRVTDRPVVVVKLSGAGVDNPVERSALWRELARATRSVDVIVVHGGGKAVDRALAERGFVTEKRDGLRVTPDDQLDVIVGVLAGQTHRALVGALLAAKAPAIGMGPCDGGLCLCEQVPALGRVGRIVGGDAAAIRTLLASGFIPVLHSIGIGADGRPLNVNADDVAVGVAKVVGATRLVLLGDVAGVLDAEGGVIPELDAAGIEGLRLSGTATGGMLPKLVAALAAAEAGAEAVIGTWNDAPALLASGAPRAGTRVVKAMERTGAAL